MTARARIPIDANDRYWLDLVYRPGSRDDGLWDEAILDEIFLGDVYRLRDDTVQAIIRDGTIVDVGANIGCFSAACLTLGAARVIAVEPEAENLGLLRENLAPWTGTSRVQIIAGAVGLPEKGPVRPRSTSGEATVHPLGVVNDAADYTVAVHPLADLLGNGVIDLLKIDVEGSEYAAFQSLESIHRPEAGPLGRVDRIFLEWHADVPEGLYDPGPGRFGWLCQELAWTHSVSAFGRPDQGGMIFAHPYLHPKDRR